MGERVSKSQTSTSPVGRAAATKRPEVSNFARVAPAKSEAWIAVGCEMLKKGSRVLWISWTNTKFQLWTYWWGLRSSQITRIQESITSNLVWNFRLFFDFVLLINMKRAFIALRFKKVIDYISQLVFSSQPLGSQIFGTFKLLMTGRQKLLLESPHLQEENNPRLSSKSSSGSYILQITSLTSYYAASASSPSNVIDLFDKSTLRGIQTLSGHEKGTTSLHTVQGLSGVIRECLVSSGKDGGVTVWDVRANAHSIKSMYWFVVGGSVMYLMEGSQFFFVVKSVSDDLWPACLALLRHFTWWTYHCCWIRLKWRGCVYFLLVRLSYVAHTILLMREYVQGSAATSNTDPRT